MSATPVRMNPTSMPDAGKVRYSQISIAGSGQLAFVSGQVAWRSSQAADAEDAAVPESIAEQTGIVIENLQHALAALGATAQHIVQLRLYLIDTGAPTQTTVMPLIMAFLDGAQPSLTGIGVASLAAPELLIEVELVVQCPVAS